MRTLWQCPSATTVGALPRKTVLHLVKQLAAGGNVFPLQAVDHLAESHKRLEDVIQELSVRPPPTVAERAATSRLPHGETLQLLKQMKRQRAELQRTVRHNAREISIGIVDTYRAIERQLLHMEEQLATRLLHAHVNGYSTTWHDLMQDLVP